MLIRNVDLASPGLELRNAAIRIQQGRILEVLPAGSPLPEDPEVLDGTGLTALPGFIDIHAHGRSGFDFSDADPAGLEQMARDKLDEGVTSWFPTTMTLPPETLRAALRTAAAYSGNGCRLPGVHLEGPFLNPACLGAQNPAYVRVPELELVRELHAIYPVRKVSFAPELPGAAAFTAGLLAMGIVPAAVHSAATYAEFARVHAAGLRHLSHFCNQMTPLHHREIGLVGAGLLHRDVYVELICDRLHLAPEMIRLLFQLKDLDHLILITDAVRASGMPDGDYTLGGLPIRLRDGAARLVSSGALAGSVLTMNTALRNVAELTGLPLSELSRTVSTNAARAFGLTDLGRIEPGFRADLTLLDREFRVRRVLVDGRIRR